MTSSRIRRTAITVGLAGGLAALGGTAIASAASSPATPTSSPSSSTSGAPTPPAPGGKHGSHGPGGRARPNSATDADGRISAVTSSTLTVKDTTGATRSYALGSSTSVHQGPQQKLSLSQLAVGEHVHVRGSGSSGSLTALDVNVLLPHIDGAVISVSGNTITVTDRDGFTRTITTSTNTTYTKSGATIGTSALTTGTPIHATGTVDPNGTTLDASNITIVVPPTPGGTTGRSAPTAPTGTSSTVAPSSTTSPPVNGS